MFRFILTEGFGMGIISFLVFLCCVAPLLACAISSSPAAPAQKFLDVDACASRYGISARTWARLVDSGRAPQPVKLGRLVRWAVADLEQWEANGCKRCYPLRETDC